MKANPILIILCLAVIVLFQLDPTIGIPPELKNSMEAVFLILMVDRLLAFIVKIYQDRRQGLQTEVLNKIHTAIVGLVTFMQDKETDRVEMIKSVNTRLGGIGRDVAVLLDRKENESTE